MDKGRGLDKGCSPLTVSIDSSIPLGARGVLCYREWTWDMPEYSKQVCIFFLSHSRSGDVVEYLLKSQWFLRCEGMAQRALDVSSGNGPLTENSYDYHSAWVY